MNEVFLGLGSNLNNPLRQLKTAYIFLQTLCPRALLSPVYCSKPLGPQDQPDFLNAVCRIQTNLSPLSLLQEIKHQEQRQYRIKQRHWGQRTIDIDILLFNDLVCRSSELTIPHPGLESRLFVLMPLADIAAERYLPNGQTVYETLQQILSTTTVCDQPTRITDLIELVD